MAEPEDDIWVLDKEEEPHDQPASISNLCAPHLNPVATPPDLASHHALATAYTTLKARYNDLDGKFKSMSRSFNDISSSKRIRPSSSSSEPLTEMAFAAAAETSESGGPELRAKQGYIQYMERELDKMKIEFQTLNMIKTSLEDKLRYYEEKIKMGVMENDKLRTANETLKQDFDIMSADKKFADENIHKLEKSVEFEKMKFSNLQKDSNNEKLKLLQSVDHWKKEYENLENAPPVISCRKCSENQKKLQKLEGDYEILMESRTRTKNAPSSKEYVRLSETDYNEFIKLMSVANSLKRTVLKQQEIIRHILNQGADAKDTKKLGRQYASSMPAALPFSRRAEEHADKCPKTHKEALPSVFEEQLSHKDIKDNIPSELNRNVVPVTHPISKAAFSDAVHHRNVKYSPESSARKDSSYGSNPTTSPLQYPLHYPYPEPSVARPEDMLAEHRPDHQLNQYPAMTVDSPSRRISDTRNMNGNVSRTSDGDAFSSTIPNVSDYVIVEPSKPIPGTSSTAPDIRIGQPVSQVDMPSYIRVGQPLSDYAGVGQQQPSVYSDSSRVSSTRNSSCDNNSRSGSQPAPDESPTNYKLIDNQRWSAEALQPVNQDSLINSELPPVVQTPGDVTPIVTTRPAMENEDRTSSFAFICPVCSHDFSYLNLDQFQTHVFDCFEHSPDSEQQTLQPEIESAVPNRVCPMCHSTFPETLSQDDFERHVNSHFELEFQML